MLAQTDAVLRARLARHGTSLVLSDSTANAGWWLMSNVTTAQARLLMTVLARPEWRADLPRLLTGLLSLQSHGAWSTTTANALGILAVNDYARKVEAHAGERAVTVALTSRAAGDKASGPEPQVLRWADMPQSDGVHRKSLDFPWPAAREGVLTLAQQGAGSGWATVTARAAVAETRPTNAGMRLERAITAVSKAAPDHWTVGDVYRVRLTIHSQEPVVWSVVSDPVPAGASILGSGLGRDSAIATAEESGDLPSWDRPTFIERDAGLYRAYFEVMNAGTQTLEYTVRINASGDFHLPPTRAEALYQPDIFGTLPNATFHVEAQP
ncbi:Alpha-2-macroglobulin OS=Castellaniella defragrans OX=75697 GN=HNR28_001586 PE=3 SV=1 [Castellaniella defragrans]